MGKPWGEVRYTWTKDEVPGLPTDYTYTGQRSYMDDPTTPGAEGFGLMFYNARWYDPQLGRFAQADTIIPEQSQGTQAWDRYAYVNNNPVMLTDPTGHDAGFCGHNDGSFCDGKKLVKPVGAFYVGPNVPRNLSEHEAEIYTEGGGGVAGAVGDADSLVSDAASVAQAASPDAPNVYVYAEEDYNSDGSVSVTGVRVQNNSEDRVFLNLVTMSSQKDPVYDIIHHQCSQSQCYAPNPPVIKPDGPNSDNLATVDAGQSQAVSLVPSGNPNTNNSFGAESLKAKAKLYFRYTAYPYGTILTVPIK